MDNKKDNHYYIRKMITDLLFVQKHTKGLTKDELKKNEVLLDSVMFRLIQISENSDKLTDAFKEKHVDVPWRALKGMRNRIVHEYGNVDLGIIYDTVIRDIPILLEQLQSIEEQMS